MKKFLIGTGFFLIFISVLSVIFPSGSHYCFNSQCGIFFWGAHEHDSVWHLAVANNLFNHWPFQMPNMSGSSISGYNYLLDIIVASLSAITRIGADIWYFKLLPIIWLVSTIYLTHKFSKTYRKSLTYPIFARFFVFFGSSFSYLLRWQNTGGLWGASSILSMQSLQNMLNPQLAWSFLLVLALFIGINEGKNRYSDYLLYGLYTMIAIGLKFYTGVAMLIIIGFDLFFNMAGNTKHVIKQILNGTTVLVMSALSVWIFYNPGHGPSPLIWKPWATVNPIVEDQSLLYIQSLAQRIYNYHNLKLILLEIIILGIFVIFNYGSRIFGLFGFGIYDNYSNPHTRKLLIIGSCATFLISILFVQSGIWWNTVQFLYVSLFLTGLLAAEGLDKLVQTKKTWGYVSVGIIILLTIPTNLDILHSFVRFPGTSYIPDDELKALQILRDLPDGTILTQPFVKREQPVQVPELSRVYDTAYISAYTNKQTYLSDTVQLVLTNIEHQDRTKLITNYDCRVISDVKYIYEYSDNRYAEKFNDCNKKIEQLFRNNLVTIYQVK